MSRILNAVEKRMPRQTPVDGRVGLWLWVCAACVASLFHAGELGWSDGRSMYEVTKSIVEDGDVTINEGVVWKGAGGSYYSPYGIGLSLVAILPYLATKSLSVLSPTPEAVLQAGVAGVGPLIFGFLAAAFYRLCRRLGVDVRTSAVVALGTMGGTFVIAYSKFFASEPLATLLIIVTIERAVAGRPVASGVAAAAAALVRPQFFSFVPLLLWRLYRDGGRSAAGRAGMPIAIGLLVAVAYNVLRFDDPWNFGYSNPEFPQGFTTPFVEGAAGLLFNPEKSVLIFAPIALLVLPGLRCLWTRQRTAFWLLAGNLALTFTISATWWAWGGGWMWGPRLLLPGLIPAVAAVAVWRQWRSQPAGTAMGALFVLGVLVNLPAMLIGAGAQLADYPHPRLGPDPFRHFSLAVAAVMSPVDAMHRGDLAIWQVKALHLLGGSAGPVVITMASLVLAAGAALALQRIGRIVRAESGLPRLASRRS